MWLKIKNNFISLNFNIICNNTNVYVTIIIQIIQFVTQKIKSIKVHIKLMLGNYLLPTHCNILNIFFHMQTNKYKITFTIH